MVAENCWGQSWKSFKMGRIKDPTKSKVSQRVKNSEFELIKFAMFARIERQNKQLCNVWKLQEIDGLCASKVRNKQSTENSKSEEPGSKSRSDKYPFQDGE
jgi:hypothetical protein